MHTRGSPVQSHGLFHSGGEWEGTAGYDWGWSDDFNRGISGSCIGKGCLEKPTRRWGQRYKSKGKESWPWKVPKVERKMRIVSWLAQGKKLARRAVSFWGRLQRAQGWLRKLMPRAYWVWGDKWRGLSFILKTFILLAHAGNRLTRLRLGRKKSWPSKNSFWKERIRPECMLCGCA